MKSNRSIIAKSAVDTSVLGTGGRMNPEQSRQFMTFMQDHSSILKKVNFIRMTQTKRNLDSLEVNKRAMRIQNENADNPATGTVEYKRRVLSTVGVIMPYNVTFQHIKENIEGKNINDTLAHQFAKQFANDSAELAFLGDESSSDDFLSINSRTEQKNPQNILQEKIKLTLPIGTDIRINDKIVDCESGLEYTAERPKPIRNHHIFVYIKRTNKQEALGWLKQMK